MDVPEGGYLSIYPCEVESNEAYINKKDRFIEKKKIVYAGHLEKPPAIKTRTINFGDYSLKYDIKSVTSTVTIPTKM